MKRNTPTQRAEKWVMERFPSLTRSQAQQSLSEGFVLDPAGKHLKKGDSVEGEPDVSGLVALLKKIRAGNPELNLSVVHEEKDYWVVDKPAGMASHPLQLTDFQTVTHWAFARDGEIAKTFPHAQPTLCPHRLDTGTSGLLIVARTQEAYELWRSRFQKKEVTKTYLAWCWGVAPEAPLVIDTPIGHHKSEYGKMATGDSPLVKEPIMRANTRVSLVCRQGELNLVEVTCATGVTHQVRVHLASAGLPLLGDQRYDPQYESRGTRPPHHALRATQLTHGEKTFRANEEMFRSLSFLS